MRSLFSLLAVAAVTCGSSLAQAAPASLQPADPVPLAAMPAELGRAPSTAVVLLDEQLDTVTAGQLGLIIRGVVSAARNPRVRLLVLRLVLGSGRAPTAPTMPVRPQTPPAATAPPSPPMPPPPMPMPMPN